MSSSSTYGPFYGSYQDTRYQFLYTASELTAMGLTAGTITEIGIEVVTKNSTGAFDRWASSEARQMQLKQLSVAFDLWTFSLAS